MGPHQLGLQITQTRKPPGSFDAVTEERGGGPQITPHQQVDAALFREWRW